MHVTVKVFAMLGRYIAGKMPGDALAAELPDGATLSDLLGQLGVPQDEVKVAFVNARARPLDWHLQADDDVGIFPPIAGG
jgi:molybdopterin synthase sulfur carrier subunit